MRKLIAILLMICCLVPIVSCSSRDTTLTFIGHASLKIVSKNGTVIYIDPAYYDYDYEDKADLILVTHRHDDHAKCSKCELKSDGVYMNNTDTLVDGEYKTFTENGIKIEAVPAGGNLNHDVRYCVGYIITVDDIVIYHAGDTSKLDSMSDLKSKNIDYAFYPIDGVYNMDAVEATEVAEMVGAKHNIPIHDFNMVGEDKAVNFTPSGKLVMEYGETIVLSK